MPKPRRQSLPADPAADARRASALVLVNKQRQKNGLPALSGEASAALAAELEAACVWYRDVSERPTLAVSAADQAVAELGALVEKIGRLIADGSVVARLAEPSPETLIASFKLLTQDEDTLEARQTLRSPTDVADARRAHAAIDQFGQEMRNRLAAWKQIALKSRGTGSIQSKALGSPKVLVLWGLLETWIQYTTQGAAADTRRGPPDVGKLFEAFAKAAVLALKGNLRTSISAARKHYDASTPGWPRFQWMNGIRKTE